MQFVNIWKHPLNLSKILEFHLFQFYHVQLSLLRIFCTLFTKNKSHVQLHRCSSRDSTIVKCRQIWNFLDGNYGNWCNRIREPEYSVTDAGADCSTWPIRPIRPCQARRQKGYTIRKWLASRTLDTPLELPPTTPFTLCFPFFSCFSSYRNLSLRESPCESRMLPAAIFISTSTFRLQLTA